MRLDPKLICICFLLTAVFFQHYKGQEQVSCNCSDQNTGETVPVRGQSGVPMSLKLELSGTVNSNGVPKIDEDRFRAFHSKFGDEDGEILPDKQIDNQRFKTGRVMNDKKRQGN